MAVSAAAAFFVVMLVAATLTSVAAVSSAVVTATAATSSEVFHEMSHFCLCGVAVLENSTFKVERFASQRVIEVDFHLLFANFHYTSVEALSLFVLQGYDGFGIYVLMVEMTVDAEYVSVEIEQVLVVILTISVVLAQCDVEVLTLCGG